MKARLIPILIAVVAFVATAPFAFSQVPLPPATDPEADDLEQPPAKGEKQDPARQDPARQDPAKDPGRKPLIPTPTPGKEPFPANPRVNAGPAPIEKPADPAKVRATYEIGGARVDITEGEFWDTHQRLHHFEPKNVGRMLNAERVYEQILAYAEAKALGLEATPEEVALFDPLAANPALLAETQKRWEAEKLTKEMYDIYQRETRTIQKAKDLFVNSARVLTTEVFDAYRRDHFTYRLEYVEFPAGRYAAEIRKKKPTDEELEAFWKEDKPTQNKLRGQSNVTADFVSFDPTAPAPNGATPPEVPRAEALAYYVKNKTRLDGMIPAEARKDLYPTAAVPIAELKTPFQILKKLGIINREVQQSGRIKSAFEEARKPDADLKAVAEKHGLTYDRALRVDRDGMLQKYSRFGPQIFSILFNHNAGDMPTDIRIEPQIQFFYRMIGKEGATLPDFATVKDKLLDPYIEGVSLRRAQNSANELRAAMDKKVDGEIRSEEERLLREADLAADAEIKPHNITEPKQVEAVKQKFRGQAMTKVRLLKDSLASKHFDAVVKELGVTLVDTGPFDLASPRRDQGTGEEAVKRKFLMANPILRSMEPGQVSQVLTDSSTRTHFLVRLAEKSEPDYSKMSDGDLLSIRAQTERARAYQPIQRFQFSDISRRRELKIN